MRKLGISIYPEKSTKERILKYIDEAHEAGFQQKKIKKILKRLLKA